MTGAMGDVEFLEPDGSVAAPAAPPPARARRPGRLSIAALLAVAGGALAVVAPFTRAYGISFTGLADAGFPGFSIDGWGRYGTDDGVSAGSHGARLGIVFCAASGIVLLAVVSRAVLRHRDDRWRRIAGAAVAFAAGAVLTVAASIVLNAVANRDSYRRALDQNAPGDSRSAAVALSLGPLLWLSIGSAVLLLAAVAVHPRGRADPPPAMAPEPARPEEAPAGHRDDELLG